MLLSPSMWSTQYMAVPFNGLSVNWYQAIADTDSTVITYPGGGYFLNSGGYVQFNASIGMITSNYPVQLIQIGQVRVQRPWFQICFRVPVRRPTFSAPLFFFEFQALTCCRMQASFYFRLVSMKLQISHFIIFFASIRISTSSVKYRLTVSRLVHCYINEYLTRIITTTSIK